MAENGNLICNNNDKDNSGSQRIGRSALLDCGTTESDAIHPRLRDDKHPKENVKCISCGQTFVATSLQEPHEHYFQRYHPQHCGSCLYCGGNVQLYRRLSTNVVGTHHNCAQWKHENIKGIVKEEQEGKW